MRPHLVELLVPYALNVVLFAVYLFALVTVTASTEASVGPAAAFGYRALQPGQAITDVSGQPLDWITISA